MRPDRIVVGEVRGAEALDMLQALNTGHEGSLSTLHANGAADALARLETLALLASTGLPLVAVRAQIAAAVDAIVHVARRAGGARRIEAVGELVRTPDGPVVRELFRWGGRGLEAVDRPVHGSRRPDVAPPDPGWFPC
jgi:pilus assembly protein CpaF